MENQITSNENAMRLFFTEDVFLVEDKEGLLATTPDVKTVEVSGKVSSETVVKPDFVEVPKITVEAKPAELVKPVKDIVEPQIFKYLGGNQKSVLILVFDEQNDVSTEAGRLLLRNIVKAVNLSTPDFALVNYAHCKDADFSALYTFFKPTLMLAFGVDTADLKLNIQWANEILLYQTTRMIFAPNLHQLDADLTAKKLLWANLKKV